MEAHASRCASGMLDSTLLISSAPRPVDVLLCFGRVKPGPTGPWSCEMGALIEGLRSLDGAASGLAGMLDSDADEGE